MMELVSREFSTGSRDTKVLLCLRLYERSGHISISGQSGLDLILHTLHYV